MLVKNAILELTITDMDCEGLGISHYENYTIFVHDALVGEVVKAKLLKVNSRIAFAKAIAILKRSKNRVIPRCPYYDKCGGCNMMHMTYEEEMRIKANSFAITIHKMVPDAPILAPIPSDHYEHYRNKIQLPVGYENDHFIVGFYQERSHHIIPSDNCLIEHEDARKVLNQILRLLDESTIYPYDEATNTGDLRHLILRVNSKGEFMVIFVVREMKEKIKKLISQIHDKRIVSIYVNVNPKATNVILGEEFIPMAYDEYLHEELFGNTYLIHPNSFFQVNYEQMKKLYQEAIDLLQPKSTDTIIDAYSGIGTITLTLAKYAKKVYGIEVVKEAVVNAKQNKAKNKISNVEFILGKCEEEIEALVKRETIDAIVMDPPRKGSDQVFLDTVINAKIPKIIYISCGPAALARDLKHLVEANYEIKAIVPVDMFSRTSNIESITLLELKK